MDKTKTDRAKDSTTAKTPERAPDATKASEKPRPAAQPVEEIGGRGGLDPTRYGDYEKDGRCVDF